MQQLVLSVVHSHSATVNTNMSRDEVAAMWPSHTDIFSKMSGKTRLPALPSHVARAAAQLTEEEIDKTVGD